MAFVQGFLATLTLDTNDITLFVTDVELAETRPSLDKSVMDGSGVSVTIPGKKNGTLSLTGHVDQANLNLLEVSWSKDVAVAFDLEISEGLTTDGKWVGTISLSDFTRGTVFDGNWSFSLSGDFAGAVTYTPSAP